MEDEDDWGCKYCRNDGRLNDDNRCPKCDAQFDADDTEDETVLKGN